MADNTRSHWEAFPHNRDIPEELIQELSGILLHAGVGASAPEFDVTLLMSEPDCMTSSSSTTIYSEPELNKLLGYVRHIKRVGGNYGFSACVIGESSTLHPIERSSRFSQVA